MGRSDSKRKGPQAISLDLAFPGFDHVYGLPERATSLALKPTVGGAAAGAVLCLLCLQHCCAVSRAGRPCLGAWDLLPLGPCCCS